MTNSVGISVGLMVPVNNTTMEPELLTWLPAGSTCHTLRIPRGTGTLKVADLPDDTGRALKLAEGFAGVAVDLVVYGCTAAGFIGGPARDMEIQFELAAITRKPVVTTASAMVAALHHIRVRRIALVTPYLDYVNERLRAYLEDSGVTVQSFASFGAATRDELAEITPAQIAALARETMSPRCEALFIACSQLPTREILDELERDFGCPVWSSIKATAWHTGAVSQNRLTPITS